MAIHTYGEEMRRSHACVNSHDVIPALADGLSPRPGSQTFSLPWCCCQGVFFIAAETTEKGRSPWQHENRDAALTCWECLVVQTFSKKYEEECSIITKIMVIITITTITVGSHRMLTHYSFQG